MEVVQAWNGVIPGMHYLAAWSGSLRGMHEACVNGAHGGLLLGL